MDGNLTVVCITCRISLGYAVNRLKAGEALAVAIVVITERVPVYINLLLISFQPTLITRLAIKLQNQIL